MSGLDAETRAYLRAEIDRRRRVVICPGCGKEIPRTSERRRYCERACANRHWHVRRALAEDGGNNRKETETFSVTSP